MMKKGKGLIVFVLLLAACGKQVEMEFVKERIFEYGEKVDAEKLIQQTNVDKKEITYPEIDTMKVGKQTLKYQVNGKTFTLKITIKDTKKPEIIMVKDTIELTQGDTFVAKDWITAVKDPVDGDLSYAEKRQKGHYTIEHNVDTNTPGTYEVQVIALDKNNNEANLKCSVVVKEKEVIPPVTSNMNNSTPPVQSTGVSDATKRMQIYEQVNTERVKAGLSPLTLDTGSLQNVANLRVNEIMVKYDHIRPDGTYCDTAVDEAGINYFVIGENIANYYGDGYTVMQEWMNSPLHRSNILHPDFTTIAIGVYGNYYVQLFIG